MMKTSQTSVEVRKVYKEDFEKVYNLLLDFRTPSIEKNQWRQLFINTWGGFEDHCGYMLVDGNKVVGFFGTVFSKRNFRGQEYKFCNLTSWIVKKEYRSKSMSLLWPILKLKDYTFTNFTCAPNLYNLFKKLGFKDLGLYRFIFPPIPPYKIYFNNQHIITEPKQIKQYLSSDDLLIYNDHGNDNCIHLIISGKNGDCYIIATRVLRKGIPFIYVHYINNLSLFTKMIYQTILQILFKYKCVGMIIEERFLRGTRLSLAIKNKTPTFKIYKSLTLPPEDIDNLYSELILLNL